MDKKIKEMITPFVESYLATAKWVTCDSGEGGNGFTKKAKETAFEDCKIFIDKVFGEFTKDEAERILNYQGNDVSVLAGHEFFLTRNGHGSGFFDRDIWNELAPNGCDRLTKLSKECGEADVWLNRGWINIA